MRSFMVLFAVVMLASLAVACGSEEGGFPENAFALVANRDIAPGEERLLIGVRLGDGTDLGSPDIPVTISVAPDDDPSAVQEVAADFSWIVPDGIGLYRARFTFDRPGLWMATVAPESGDALAPSPFVVMEDNIAPSLGEAAPVAPTPTLDDKPLAELTTDPRPNPALYETSLEEALGNGRPTLLVFATPAFCQTAACGPLLDNVKDVMPGYPGVNFLHVEVYTGFEDPAFDPANPAFLAPAVGAEWWNLPSEPWGFVIDGAGVIVARFEGTLDAEELIPSLGAPSE